MFDKINNLKLTTEPSLLPPIEELIFKKSEDLGEIFNNLKSEEEDIFEANYKGNPNNSESKNFYSSLNNGRTRSLNLMMELSNQPRSYDSLLKTTTNLKKDFDVAKNFNDSQKKIHNEKRQAIREQVLKVEHQLNQSKLLLTTHSFDDEFIPVCKINDLQHHDEEHNSPEVITHAKDMVIAKVCHVVEHTYGKIPGKLCEFTLQATCSAVSDDSQHLKRNALISIGVHHVAIPTLISNFVPGAVLPYMVMIGAQELKNFVRKQEKAIEESGKREEIEYFMNKQVQTMGEGISYASAMQLLQLPGDIIEGIHHEGTDLLIKICDKIESQKDNIDKIKKVMAEFSQDALSVRNSRGQLIERVINKKSEENPK